MTFTDKDYEQLHTLMQDSPENQRLIQKLLDAQTYTISKISHEIRNPLALVYSTLQLIESQHPEVQTFRHWDDMRQDIEYITALLQELSDYNNGERLHKEPFSFHSVISRMCLSFAATCADSNIEFTSRISPDLPSLTGDQIKLKEVFLNLLKNALDAVSKDGHIALSADVCDAKIKVQISDDGCGIAPEDLSSIFDTFVTHKSNGTGLGLSIAKRIVEAHHGSISVSSTLGRGSCFTVILPVV